MAVQVNALLMEILCNLQDALTDASARMREVRLPQLLGQDTPSFMHRVQPL